MGGYQQPVGFGDDGDLEDLNDEERELIATVQLKQDEIKRKAFEF